MSKRQERSSSSGSESSIKMEAKLRRIEEDERAASGIHTALELLSTRIERSFSELSDELSTFRHEIQTDIKEIKQNIREQEKCLEAVWSRSEEAERKIDEMCESQRHMHEEISLLKQELKDQKEKNIALEAYTRRENLIFRNVFESADDDPKKIILNILRVDFEIDTSDMRFHAHTSHRKKQERSGKADNSPIRLQRG